MVDSTSTQQDITQNKKKILLVDDDQAAILILKQILELEGYAVDTAETGKLAVLKIEYQFYNLVLLDIVLPDIKGTELLEWMHGHRPSMMKIMVTGYPNFENVFDALKKGADAYLIKPVDPEKLLKIVEEKLAEQAKIESMAEEKIAEWIENRINDLNEL